MTDINSRLGHTLVAHFLIIQPYAQIINFIPKNIRHKEKLTQREIHQKTLGIYILLITTNEISIRSRRLDEEQDDNA